MNPSTLSALAQFGVAGLIAWMWLTERRASAHRDRQIDEAHSRLMHERRELTVLVDLVSANTRAMVALEAQQRDLLRLLDRLTRTAA